MITNVGVKSTMSKVPHVEVNVDTVYERYNIKDIHTEEQPILWEYDENQLTMQEYLIKQAREMGGTSGAYIGTGEPQSIECPRNPMYLIVNGQTVPFDIKDDEIIINDYIEEGTYYSYLLIYT